MIEGLVSTIIPVYNRSRMLAEAVESVLAQTWTSTEVIIVDDGSTDDTLDAARALATAHPDLIRVLQQTNAGPGVARQVGLLVSRGEFTQFLDSDDLLLPNKFSKQVEGLRVDTQAGISYGKCYSRNNGVRQPGPAQATGERHRTLFPALLDGPLWPTHSPLYRRSVLDSIGPWPAGKQLEDWLYDAQAGALGVLLHYVDDFIAETRNHEEARLCHLWVSDMGAMRERLAAYPVVLWQSQRAGVDFRSPYMQRFARTLFWMARNAGRFGFPQEAEQLFALARAQAVNPGWDYRIFGVAAAIFGWSRASRWAEVVRGSATWT